MQSRSFLWLCAILLIGSGIAEDIPFVFDEQSANMAYYSSSQLERLSGDSLDLTGISSISLPQDNEVIEFPIVGGGSKTSDKRSITIGEFKKEINPKIESNNIKIFNKAREISIAYSGDPVIDSVCAIYEYLKKGDGSKISGWSYVSDPLGPEYFRYANETLELGKKIGCSGVGDCDDFAILMASLIDSMGGTSRIVFARNQEQGHAYAEVYIGKVSPDNQNVENIIEWLKIRYDTRKIYVNIDSTTRDVWLNLDWSAYNPGGPFFKSDIQKIVYNRTEKLNLKLSPGLIWAKAYNLEQNSKGIFVAQTNDNGYIITGSIGNYSKSFRYNNDVCIIKTDSNGNKEWFNTFGGEHDEEGKFIQPTEDGGYFIVCQSPYSIDQIDYIWLIKTDSEGLMVWDKKYKLPYSRLQWKTTAKETLNGDYIITSWTIDSREGDGCLLSIKINHSGEKIWENTFEGSAFDYALSIQETKDKGYVILKAVDSNSSSRFGLIKIDENGNKNWERSFGNAPNDFGKYIQETDDGGFIIVGSYEDHANGDIWLLKTDINGNRIWDVSFGGYSGESGDMVLQTKDGGYIVIGRQGWGTTDNIRDINLWIIKTDKNGNKEWDKILERTGSPAESLLAEEDSYVILAAFGLDNTAPSTEKIALIKLDGKYRHDLNAEDWLQEGNSLSRMGRENEALDAYEKAIEIDPQYSKAWIGKGILLKYSNPEGAILALDKAIELDPKSVEAWNHKAESLRVLHRYEDALGSIENAVKLDPENAQSWYNKGAALFELGRYMEALPYYDKAFELNYIDAEAPWFDKARALTALSRFEEALNAYDMAIKLAIGTGNAAVDYNEKGKVLASLGRYDEAIQSFERANELEPYINEAWYNKGLAFRTLGRNTEADLAFSKAKEFGYT